MVQLRSWTVMVVVEEEEKGPERPCLYIRMIDKIKLFTLLAESESTKQSVAVAEMRFDVIRMHAVIFILSGVST